MTDRFSIELRKHFVETADEVVRANELERVLRVVMAVPQRSPWHVRLRWVVSPWAPRANAGVRTGLILAAAALLLAAMIGVVVVGGAGSGQGPPGSPFEGSWKSTDPVDHSLLTLVVGPGPTPAVHFEDAFGMTCHLEGDTSFLFLADGAGQVEGDRMVVSFTGGGCVAWQIPAFDTTFDHDPLTDALVNSAGESWVRDEARSSAP